MLPPIIVQRFLPLIPSADGAVRSCCHQQHNIPNFYKSKKGVVVFIIKGVRNSSVEKVGGEQRGTRDRSMHGDGRKTHTWGCG